jgi:hypothetical protein
MGHNGRRSLLLLLLLLLLLGAVSLPLGPQKVHTEGCCCSSTAFRFCVLCCLGRWVQGQQGPAIPALIRHWQGLVAAHAPVLADDHPQLLCTHAHPAVSSLDPCCCR